MRLFKLYSSTIYSKYCNNSGLGSLYVPGGNRTRYVHARMFMVWFFVIALARTGTQCTQQKKNGVKKMFNKTIEEERQVIAEAMIRQSEQWRAKQRQRHEAAAKEEEIEEQIFEWTRRYSK